MKWHKDWIVENPDGQKIVTNPTFKQPDFDWPRKI